MINKKSKKRLYSFNYVLILTCLLIVIWTIPKHPYLGFFPAAVVFGWAQIGGV